MVRDQKKRSDATEEEREYYPLSIESSPAGVSMEKVHLLSMSISNDPSTRLRPYLCRRGAMSIRNSSSDPNSSDGPGRDSFSDLEHLELSPTVMNSNCRNDTGTRNTSSLVDWRVDLKAVFAMAVALSFSPSYWLSVSPATASMRLNASLRWTNSFSIKGFWSGSNIYIMKSAAYALMVCCTKRRY